MNKYAGISAQRFANAQMAMMQQQMLEDMEDYGEDDYYDDVELVDSQGQPIKMMNNGQVMYAYPGQG